MSLNSYQLVWLLFPKHDTSLYAFVFSFLLFQSKSYLPLRTQFQDPLLSVPSLRLLFSLIPGWHKLQHGAPAFVLTGRGLRGHVTLGSSTVMSQTVWDTLI